MIVLKTKVLPWHNVVIGTSTMLKILSNLGKEVVVDRHNSNRSRERARSSENLDLYGLGFPMQWWVLQLVALIPLGFLMGNLGIL